MTERERAARALIQAEVELQRAVSAQLRREKGHRKRLAAAKAAMVHTYWRACRACGVRPERWEAHLPDYGLGRLTVDAMERALRGQPIP